MVVLASGYLLVWSTVSTSIDSVEPGVLSMARLLPFTYWAGFALLLASTIIWYFSGETKVFHLLLVALWMGYVFLGPELMEAHPRGVSSYAQAWGIAYVLDGRGAEFYYSPWLGFHSAFGGLVSITGVVHLAMMRIGIGVLYLALAVALIALFRRVLPDRKSTLLATLTALTMVAVLGVGFTPHQLAFVLMLFAFAILARPQTSSVVNRFMLIVLFCSILITHALSALIVVYVTAMAALVRSKRLGVGPWSASTASLSLLFAVLFVAWLMYSSDFWFPNVVTTFRDTVLREPTAFISPFSHVTPARAGAGRPEVSFLVFAFLAVLLAWLVTVVASRRFWNGLGRDRLFPLLAVSGLPILVIGTGSFSFEAFFRVFLYAIPFLAWFLARESAARRSAAAFLLALLGVGFVLLYAREFEELPTSPEFAGANFLVEATPPNVAVIQGECLPLAAITNTIEAPYTACLSRKSDQPEPGLYGLSDQFSFVVLSELGERTAGFAFGGGPFEVLRDAVQDPMYGKIYSNGGYDVYVNHHLDVNRPR